MNDHTPKAPNGNSPWREKSSSSEAIEPIHPEYSISKLVSEGTCGALYRGKSLIDHQTVLIRRFNEGICPKRLKSTYEYPLSDYIIRVSDALSTRDGVNFTVSKYPDGACLEHVLEKKKKFAAATAVKIALQLAMVVQTLHKNGKGHGQINPKHIFISRKEKGTIEVYLLHFEHQGRASRINEVSYLSPEQTTEGKGVRPSDDMWAITALLYQMLLGVPAFSGDTDEEIIGRILTEELVLNEALEKNFLSLASFMYRGMSKAPNERFEDCEEMIRKLTKIHDSLQDGAAALSITQSFIAAVQTEVSSTVPISSDPEPHQAEMYSPDHNFHERVTPPANLYITSENMAVREEPSRRSTLPSPASENVVEIMLMKDVDMTLPSFSSALIARQEQQQVNQKKRTRVVLAIAIAAVLMLSTAVSVYFATRSSTPTVSARQTNPVSEIISNVGEATEESPPANNDPSQPSVGDTPGPETVTITIENLPQGAVVTVNGKPSATPITIEKSEEPLALHTFVGNRLVFASTVVPTEPQVIDFRMASNDEAAAKRKKKKQHKKDDARQSSGPPSGKLSSNPYNLRKNPFAQGD